MDRITFKEVQNPLEQNDKVKILDYKNKSLLDMIQNNIISASIQEVENPKNFLGEAEIVDEQ